MNQRPDILETIREVAHDIFNEMRDRFIRHNNEYAELKTKITNIENFLNGNIENRRN